ncbi:DUF6935 domain-containing protein [Rhodoflexus caldus]|uniref:DUF6935 domain-containing protein n=1 Tax=Rhodoflexus caldus TaxID=2891236 RepID=UPI00202A9B5B|nr:hypothetical protein [Rhodoflexus caldus]
MKNILALCLLLIGGAAFAQKQELPAVSFEKIPESVEEFISLRDRLATTPQGGAAVFVIASIMYVRNPETGYPCLIIASDKSLLSPSDKGGYQGFDFGSSSAYLVKQLDSKKYVPYSYILGTKPATSYALGNPPHRVACSTNPYSGKESDGQLKVFVRCSGADSDRPLTLVRNDRGIWKAKEFSSLMVGVRPPQQKSAGAANGDF